MPLISTKERVYRPVPVPGFPTLCVVVFIVVSDFEETGGFVDIDGIVGHHGLLTSFHNHISHRIVKYKSIID
jgi:hypothetical protein